MAAVSVRGLDEEVKERLRIRAAGNGRSMESEIRAILVAVVSEPERSEGLFTTILERFGDLGGVDLHLPQRATPVRAAHLAS